MDERPSPTPPPSTTRRFVDAPDGARDQLAARVAALRQPASYAEQTDRVEAIETHMSWVFLTDAHAYKLKKPLRTPLLDHTSLEARRRACENESQLNRRLAATVYLGVVPVVATRGAIRVDVAGEPVDWLVRMRRLPRERMLDARIERGALDAGALDPLATKLTDFYQRAEPAGLAAKAYRDRLSADIAAKRASLIQERYGLDRGPIDAAASRLQGWLEAHRDVVGERAASVVDAHGDLRPEHICLQSPPVVIDCLDFDRDLRLLDPVSELSFLALECRRLGADWVGRHLLDAYMTRSGDRPRSALVGFYQSYHALVRAAVAAWHLDDDTVDHAEKWRGKASRYVRLAAECLDASR